MAYGRDMGAHARHIFVKIECLALFAFGDALCKRVPLVAVYCLYALRPHDELQLHIVSMLKKKCYVV